MSNYSDSQQHEMHLERVYPAGAEEWFCPTCGRRFLMRWSPTYEKIILEAGDESVVHSGSKGGLHLGLPQISETEGEPVLSDELRAALEEVLQNVDLDDWPKTTD